jgi:hypothetical protein
LRIWHFQKGLVDRGEYGIPTNGLVDRGEYGIPTNGLVDRGDKLRARDARPYGGCNEKSFNQ